MHTAISVVHTCGCDLLDAHDERCCITRPRLIRIQRACHSKQRAGLAYACFISVTQFIKQQPLAGRLQSFFVSSSCSMALSSDRSATSFLSLVFSSSNCLSRLTSDGPRPPYFFFQL